MFICNKTSNDVCGFRGVSLSGISKFFPEPSVITENQTAENSFLN